MSILLFLFLAQIHTRVLATSSVSVLIPLDCQLPPIARINNSYTWSFAENTFSSKNNASFIFSVPSLSSWLSFDPETRTFSGIPTPDDEGTLHFEVVASDPTTSDSAASPVSICVTSYPTPALTIPISSQFRTSNPSLSSVFLLSNYSALKMADRPTLRIPSGWSFSIGFEGDTFTSTDDIRYTVLQADGSPLPPWMVFNTKGITLGGFVPSLSLLPTPYSLSLALHALDKNGFSAAHAVFDVVIASQEVHAVFDSLPTVNTTSPSLDVSFNSSMDFAGVLVDDAPIDLQDVDSVIIDVSQYSWLDYDADSRRLTGQLPGDFATRNATVLPVILSTTSRFNQTLNTRVKLAVVPSYFSKDTLPPILAAPGRDVHFDLTPFFSNAIEGENVDLTASFSPSDASAYLSFDTASAILSGKVPSSGVDYSHITVTFTAYSRLTHSTSHTSLPISLTPADYGHTQPTTGPRFRKPHKNLTLVLGITLGLLGGLLVLGLLLAALRCWARPPDSALTGEAAIRAMTESDRQWYGIENAADGGDSAEKGYSVRANGHQWDELGLGLSRTITRVSSSDERTLASPGQLSKAEFLGRLRATVRNVSNRYRRARKSAIGPPVLVEAGDPRALSIPATPTIPALEGYEPAGYTGTTSSLRGSPSLSTDGRSIPQRRADFAPPRMPAPVAVAGARHSLDSEMSLASDSSTHSHAAEAVVQRATRARSVRSARSAFGQSQVDTRARIVPFTASRVPAPRDGAAGAGTSFSPPRRASSLSASVVRVVAPPQRHARGGGGGGSSATETDELHVGLHYVRALGEDAREASGSFSSVESSHPARSSVGSGGTGVRGEVLRVLVRVGERFRFRLPVHAGVRGAGLTARRVSGEVLPAFLYADLDIARGDKHQNTVKFWGVPRADDIGEVHVGVYAVDGACVAQAVIEVLMRSG